MINSYVVNTIKNNGMEELFKLDNENDKINGENVEINMILPDEGNIKFIFLNQVFLGNILFLEDGAYVSNISESVSSINDFKDVGIIGSLSSKMIDFLHLNMVRIAFV